MRRYLRKIKIIYISFILVIVFNLGGCTQIESETIASIDISDDIEFKYTQEDLRVYPNADAQTINLDGMDTDLLISNGGDYILSGSFEHSIIIDANEYVVHLFLDNVSVNSVTDNAIIALSASKIIITCVENSNNSFEDGEYYENNKEYDACIYSVPDLTFNGSGELYIKGIYEDAIHSKDILKISGCKLEVQSKGDSLRGNDGISIVNANVSCEAEKDGLRTSKNGAGVKGNIVIKETELSVIAGRNAIEAYDRLVICGSKVYLYGIYENILSNNGAYIEEGNIINE